MSTQCEEFRQLHFNDQPLLLPNIWDAASARLCEEAGATALATSSAALAWSLGYADGGGLPQAELVAAVRRIARVARRPLTVDVEDGYSRDPRAVADLVVQVVDAGAVGINLEDGADAPELLSEKVAEIRTRLGRDVLFINARTDVLLRGLAQGEAARTMLARRLNQYHAAGADGAFVPGVREVDDIRFLVAVQPMPLNAMLVGGMASVAALAQAGVRRFSAGAALFQSVYGTASASARRMLQDDDPSWMLQGGVAYGAMNALFARD